MVTPLIDRSDEDPVGPDERPELRAETASAHAAMRVVMDKLEKRVARARRPLLLILLVLALTAGYVAVTAIIDFGFWESTFGFDPIWTWVLAIGGTVIVIGLCHNVLARVVDTVIATSMADRRGLRWRAAVAALGVSGVLLLVFAVAVSWARAKSFAFDTSDVLGGSSPGFWTSLLFFIAMHLLGYVGGTVPGSASIERQDSPRRARAEANKVSSLGRRADHKVRRIADRADGRRQVIARQAGITSAPAPVEVPLEIRERIDAIIEEGE